MTFHPDSLPDLSSRVFIVTGATSGIGYHTAARLAQHNAHVYVCARSAEKGSAAIENIKSRYSGARLSCLIIDHRALATVQSAANYFLSKETTLHGLVNNAGIMATPFEMTCDGYEEQWQTNFIAHWLLTHYLLPVMLKTSKSSPAGSVRIVNLSSSAHLSPPKSGINFQDTSLPEATSMNRYAQSKLANVLHTKILHFTYGPGSTSTRSGNGEIWSTAVHPGLVDTGLGRRAELPLLFKFAISLYKALGGAIDADRGSWTSIFCAASQEMTAKHSGAYFQRIADPKGWQSGLARDAGLAARLEEWMRQEMKTSGWIV